MNNHTVNFSKLDLNLLKVFACVYTSKNMTHVAEQLFLTPSAVSHSIKRLREALGDPLFIRDGKHLLPTSKCRRFAPSLLNSLAAMELSVKEFNAFTPHSAQYTFTLAIHHAIEPNYGANIVKYIHKQAPKTCVQLIELKRPQLAEQLKNGQVDFALDCSRAPLANLSFQTLDESRLVALVRKGHILTSKVDLDTYQKGLHCTVSSRPNGRSVDEVLLSEFNLARQIVARCQNYHTALKLVSGSDMILTMPAGLNGEFCPEELQQIELPFITQTITSYLYWHDNALFDPALNWLKEHILLALNTPRRVTKYLEQLV